MATHPHLQYNIISKNAVINSPGCAATHHLHMSIASANLIDWDKGVA